MTLLGIELALLGFVPNVNVPAELILPALLPPLLYAALRRTSWRLFAANATADLPGCCASWTCAVCADVRPRTRGERPAWVRRARSARQ